MCLPHRVVEGPTEVMHQAFLARTRAEQESPTKGNKSQAPPGAAVTEVPHQGCREAHPNACFTAQMTEVGAGK